jgi:hypothetical protein
LAMPTIPPSRDRLWAYCWPCRLSEEIPALAAVRAARLPAAIKPNFAGLPDTSSEPVTFSTARSARLLRLKGSSIRLTASRETPS